MLQRLFIMTLLMVFSFIVSSCKNEEVKTQAPPEIKIVKTIVKDVPIYKEFVGQIYGYVDIPIRARVTGFLEGIHFDEGKRVAKGQLLYSIDPQPYLAEVAAQKSKLAEAKTEQVRADNELIRYESLIKTRAVSQSDYDANKAEAEAARAAVLAAKANVTMAEINLGYCKLTSPVDGLIGRTQAKVGEFVGKEPNPVILNTVSKISDVRVNFFLTESEYLMLARNHQNEIERTKATPNSIPDSNKVDLRLILSDGSMHKHIGHVDFVNREVDAMTGSMLVQATFPNPEKILRPGQYAKVKIELEHVENAILIPQKCIQELQGKYAVFVVADSNKVESRQISIKEHLGDLALIDKGIDKNDKILIEGIQQVKSGMTISPKLVTFKSQTKAQ